MPTQEMEITDEAAILSSTVSADQKYYIDPYWLSQAQVEILRSFDYGDYFRLAELRSSAFALHLQFMSPDINAKLTEEIYEKGELKMELTKDEYKFLCRVLRVTEINADMNPGYSAIETLRKSRKNI